MCHRNRTNKIIVLAVVLLALPLSLPLAQESPAPDDAFEVEPPLLVPPAELGRTAEEPAEKSPDITQLETHLEQAKRSAASAERLVKSGVLAKAEAEQRALRAVRLESELAKAQLTAAQEQVTLQKSRLSAGQGNKEELDAAIAILARASATAQAANERYHKAQLDAATLNLHRQRRLLALGSAHRSDVARAEEKLEKLQRPEKTAH
jgi:hypothetical protein